MNDDNYLSVNEQGLAEISPTASRDAQLAFIDTFRQTQGENTQQIADTMHELGSDLEAPYGGLHGPSEYMKSRYQTPQTESRLAGLRTAAQLTALNQLMQNDLAKWKDKYNQEYKKYQKRQRAKANSLLGNGTGSNSPVTGGVDEEVSDTSVDYSTSATNVPSLNVNNETYVDADGNLITRDMNTKEILYINGIRKDEYDAAQKQSAKGGGGYGW